MREIMLFYEKQKSSSLEIRIIVVKNNIYI